MDLQPNSWTFSQKGTIFNQTVKFAAERYIFNEEDEHSAKYLNFESRIRIFNREVSFATKKDLFSTKQKLASSRRTESRRGLKGRYSGDLLPDGGGGGDGYELPRNAAYGGAVWTLQGGHLEGVRKRVPKSTAKIRYFLLYVGELRSWLSCANFWVSGDTLQVEIKILYTQSAVIHNTDQCRMICACAA